MKGVELYAKVRFAVRIACLDARSDAPLAFPGFGAVAGFGIAPHHRRLALGMAHPHIVGGDIHLPVQHIVAADAV